MLLGSKAVVFYALFQGEQEAEMQKEVLKEPTYVEELLTLFRSNLGKEELLEKISDYHESDIADAMEQMTPEERKKTLSVAWRGVYCGNPFLYRGCGRVFAGDQPGKCCQSHFGDGFR